jgi:hypothetical protein
MDIVALNPSAFCEALPKSRQALLGFRIVLGKGDQRADAPHPVYLLRACRHWPRRRRGAQERNDLAPLHSITSSASANSLSGTVRPSVLAVLRLIIHYDVASPARSSHRWSLCDVRRSEGAVSGELAEVVGGGEARSSKLHIDFQPQGIVIRTRIVLSTTASPLRNRKKAIGEEADAQEHDPCCHIRHCRHRSDAGRQLDARPCANMSAEVRGAISGRVRG